MVHFLLLLLANRNIVASGDKLLHVGLYLLRDVEGKVHVGRLLELAFTDVALITIVLRTRDPANVVILVELPPQSAVLLGNAGAKSVVVDEDVGGSSVGLVVGDGLLKTANGGNNDRVETLLVDRHLDGDSGSDKALGVSLLHAGLLAGVEAGVCESATDGTDHLQQTAEDGLEEEQTDDEEQRRGRDEGEADVLAVQETLADDLADVDTAQKADAQANRRSGDEGRQA